MKRTHINLALILLLSVIGFYTCKPFYFRSAYHHVNELIHETKNLTTVPYLKAHLKNGDVCILKDSWKADTIQNVVSGVGSRYDFNRYKIYQGALLIPIDSVAIFETNKKLIKPEAARITALTILTAMDVALGIYCFTNPKACFGSCPTFYMNENDNFHYADAEGFSNAISPSLEYGDVDALDNLLLKADTFSLTMKNEAMETHCVNDVKLLVYPRKQNERVYHDGKNEFYLCDKIYPVKKAIASEGDITKLLSLHDKLERFSLASGENLYSKEEVILEFDDVKLNSDLGLLLHFRQTLMSTYFIYSAIGYMGNEVSDIFAKMEGDKVMQKNLQQGIWKDMNSIDFYIWNEDNSYWKKIDYLYETGPIAINKQILPVGNNGNGKKVKLKLVLNQGLWRLDYAALTAISKSIEPIELLPDYILNKGVKDDYALFNLNHDIKYLISMPGSEYKFRFALPDPETDYEMFVYSKGYYLEWMRANWIKDKNLLKLHQMTMNPSEYFMSEVEEYKIYEKTMEKEFWNSRIDTRNFSYHEN